MTWDILILTMPTRQKFLRRLLDQLEQQVAARMKAVKLTWKLHASSMTLGEARQDMRESSTADYISFVDDDDLVSEDYVERILPLLDGVDYVGFRVQAYEDGVALPGPTYHSLLCGGWFDKTYVDGTKSWHRDISHLNPIRRELALAVPMYGGYAEDSRWAGDLRRLGIVKTEHYIEDVMYHYLSRTDKTDGVVPGPTSSSAGICPACQSPMTVLVNGSRFCNACGATFTKSF